MMQVRNTSFEKKNWTMMNGMIHSRDRVALRIRRRTRTSGAVTLESVVSSMIIGTRLFTWMRGELVGSDAQGNKYYQDRRVIPGRRRKRWVMYNGVAEASRVPPEWHGWLHYTTAAIPPAGGVPRKPWQKEHQPNLTGTDMAYRPPGHSLSSAEKPKPPYEAWRPG